jgi:hypothetical protein
MQTPEYKPQSHPKKKKKKSSMEPEIQYDS